MCFIRQLKLDKFLKKISSFKKLLQRILFFNMIKKTLRNFLSFALKNCIFPLVFNGHEHIQPLTLVQNKLY